MNTKYYREKLVEILKNPELFEITRNNTIKIHNLHGEEYWVEFSLYAPTGLHINKRGYICSYYYYDSIFIPFLRKKPWWAFGFSWVDSNCPLKKAFNNAIVNSIGEYRYQVFNEFEEFLKKTKQ